VRSPSKRQAKHLVLALTAALLAAPAATADPVSSKQAQARQVLGQIQQIDASMERAVEAYDAATVKLQKIERDQRENRHDLVIARASLQRSQVALSRRLVQIYTTSDETAGLGVLLGATSLDDFLNRVDTQTSMSSQDSSIVRQVTASRAAVQRHQRALATAHAGQARVVGQRAAQRASISRQLAQRRSLLSSIQGQIAHLKAMERARQIALAGQARARIASTPAPSDPSTVVGASAAVPGATAAPPSSHGGVVGIAMRYLGVPYRWGGASPSGFDCSGLVMYVYGKLGIHLTHFSGAQYHEGVPVPRDALAPGDLVFFDQGPLGPGHVGIYAGGGEFIQAPHTGDVVKISSLSDASYALRYVGAVRPTG
jgi:cell wall-associated NlpC family hydrolase